MLSIDLVKWWWVFLGLFGGPGFVMVELGGCGDGGVGASSGVGGVVCSGIGVWVIWFVGFCGDGGGC